LKEWAASNQRSEPANCYDSWRESSLSVSVITA